MKIPRHCQEELCKEFFTLFSRFEYAMKAIGFREKVRGQIKILWNDMADTVRQPFIDTDNDELKSAIKYIMNEPPKKQDIVHDELTWVDSDANQGDKHYDLFIYVRRVRNNLFHGGKFQGKYLADPERSLELVKHCTIVLNACLEINNDLNEAFTQ